MKAAASISIHRPQRWDEPFSDAMSDADVDWLLTKPPLSRIDSSKFPSATPLRGILENDTRIIRSQPGDIIVREGDYGHSAFLILGGKVRVIVGQLDEEILGRQQTRKKTLLQALRQAWANSRLSEVRDTARYGKASGTDQRGQGSEVRVFLQDAPAIFARQETVLLEEGTFFGEIAALGRTPRTATVIADGECALLEIRWQGLRDIRRWADEVKAYIDQLYRERSLKVHLKATPVFSHLSEEELSVIAQHTSFESFGSFDWHGSYMQLENLDPSERVSHEPAIAKEGDYPGGLIMIRAGFTRLTEQVDRGDQTVSYLGRGAAFGFSEIAHNWRFEGQLPLQQTLRAVGYVDVLRVPTFIIEKYVLPTIPENLLPPPIKVRITARSAWKEAGRPGLDAGLLEFLVDNRIVNGTATMLIDLDRCTRCDDCVRACAAAHDNNPRFIRHGNRHGRYLVANACMHCVDPVCMIGCPTGAIHRDSYGGHVVINDSTCIGCSTCANSCPYSNIQMVQIRDHSGAVILDQNTGFPIVKATKCDLCGDQLGGPACQRACPHDALVRMDMTDHQALLRWVTR